MGFLQFEVHVPETLYHYLITQLSSCSSTSLSSTVCTILVVFILQLFWKYSLCSEVPIISQIMPAYSVHPYTELWTSQNNGAIRETEIINYLKINTD